MPQIHHLDLVIIGTGAGGSGAAYRCRRAGWRVAIVDDLPFGGTCALRGCDPKKVLVGAADLVAWSGRMQGHGVSGKSAIDWPALMRFKRSFTDPVPAARLAGFQRAGIVPFQGEARFLSPDRLAVGDETLESRHFLIAAGARPRPLRISGDSHLITSTEFLELDRLPKRIAFVGGGYVSFEFAHVSQRAGAQAVILSRGAPLERFDQDLVGRLVRHTREIGVEVRTDSEVVGIEREGGRYRVLLEAAEGPDAVEADLVVHGAGRVPHTEKLELGKANVATDAEGGVVVNQFLQSVSNPRVYAAGDAARPPGSLPLTPVAAYESVLVASNLLEGNSRTPDYRGIPSVVFTIPPLAGVGLTEVEARRERHEVRIKSEDTSSWYSHRRVNETCAMFKTIVEQGSDRILGAHLLGTHAEEVINLFALAIRQGLSATAIKHQLYAYPTSGADLPYMLS
ncbi:MAG: dihydrolipoyl dehydrogenase family protein [Gemmatimonadales bacterium]